MTDQDDGPVAPEIATSKAQGPQGFPQGYQPKTIRELERASDQRIKEEDAASRRKLYELAFRVCLGLFLIAFVVSFGIGVGGRGDARSWMQGVFAGMVGAAAGYATGVRSK